jgi:hypothetical protein
MPNFPNDDEICRIVEQFSYVSAKFCPQAQKVNAVTNIPYTFITTEPLDAFETEPESFAMMFDHNYIEHYLCGIARCASEVWKISDAVQSAFDGDKGKFNAWLFSEKLDKELAALV